MVEDLGYEFVSAILSEHDTLAGLCLDLAGAMPAVGTELRTEDGLVLEIVEATPRRILKVRVRRGTAT